MTENQCEALMAAIIVGHILNRPFTHEVPIKEVIDFAEKYVDEIKSRTLSLGE